MTAHEDFEAEIRRQLTRVAANAALSRVTSTGIMNRATEAILAAGETYAARCIAQPVSDVADHPLITAGRRMAAVAEADAKVGRRPARNRKERP